MARKKPMKAPGGVDHISDLPDNLLIHILSSLPTKHAIRTSLLSKRWQWLWIHVPVLEIEICRPLGDDPRELLFLDKALDLHTSPKITKLHLSGHRIPVLDEGVAQRLDLLVRSAVACHVDELSLFFFSLDGKIVYTLPEEIYSCGSLRELKTMGCRFFPNGRVACSSFRVLEVASGMWSDDMIAGLLAGCPALESLTLRFFTGIRLIDVKSPTRLKELVMDGCFDVDGNPELCIHAPYLEELELLGIWEFLRPNLVNVGSLVNVHLSLFFLDFKQNRKANTVTKLLEMVPQVKQLKIESWNMEDLSRENWPYPPLSSLKYLVVNVCFCLDHHLLVLRNLFRCAPTLDSLTLQFSHSCCTLEPRYDDKISDALTSRVEKLGGLLSNVKIVKLLEIGLTGRWFKLSEFLLKDLMMLEKMIIYPVPSLQTKSLLQLTKSLLSLPRSSPRAVVMIQ